MNINNPKLKRNLLFCFISSIEADIRNNLLTLITEGLRIDENILEKVKERQKKDTQSEKEDYSVLINYLDIGDYIQIYNSNSNLFSNKSKLKKLLIALENIIPCRNRIMHGRPLEFDDDKKIINFVSNAEKYKDVISFSETISENEKIKKDPNYLLSITSNISLFNDNTVKNNLPMVDYDDTGFVGRINDKELLKKKILGPYPVISVIGIGGVGKTSLVLSTLYDLLENDPKFNEKFDSIIWITLKTKCMTNGDFKNIKDAITNLDTKIKTLSKKISKDNISQCSEILKYMSENKTLLIIDNLETLDRNSDINSLFEDIPQESKILITSRIGIGNYEQTYHLEKLSENDAMTYFRKLCNIYNVSCLQRQKEQQIKNYLTSLSNNPLAIKWFVINVGKGMTPDNILNNEINNLTDFCLSNIYEKLSDKAKYILRIILTKHNRCGAAELLYLCELSYDECMESINELFKSNFLIQNEDFSYSVLDFAISYIQSKKGYSNYEFENKIQQAIKKLNGKLENLKNDIHLTNEYHPLSLFPKNDNERIATLYVLSAIENSISKNYNEVDKCLTLASYSDSKFSDIYKIAGYLYSKFDTIKSEDNYEIAINLADNKAPIHYFYAGSLINNHRYDDAEYEINEAMKLEPSNLLIKMRYARLKKMQANYKNSLELLNSLKKDITKDLPNKMYIKYIFEMIDTRIRYADSLIRIDNTQAYNITIDAINFVNTIDPNSFDFTIYNSLFKLTYLYIQLLSCTDYSIDEFINYLSKYYPYILAAKNGNKKEQNFEIELENLKKKINVIDAKKINNIINFNAKINEINHGYIIKLSERGFGFIKPESYSYQTIYFHCTKFKGDFRSLKINDRVSFKLLVSNKTEAIDIQLATKEKNDEILFEENEIDDSKNEIEN